MQTHTFKVFSKALLSWTRKPYDRILACKNNAFCLWLSAFHSHTHAHSHTHTHTHTLTSLYETTTPFLPDLTLQSELNSMGTEMKGWVLTTRAKKHKLVCTGYSNSENVTVWGHVAKLKGAIIVYFRFADKSCFCYRNFFFKCSHWEQSQNGGKYCACTHALHVWLLHLCWNALWLWNQASPSFTHHSPNIWSLTKIQACLQLTGLSPVNTNKQTNFYLGQNSNLWLESNNLL